MCKKKRGKTKKETKKKEIKKIYFLKERNFLIFITNIEQTIFAIHSQHQHVVMRSGTESEMQKQPIVIENHILTRFLNIFVLFVGREFELVGERGALERLEERGAMGHPPLQQTSLCSVIQVSSNLFVFHYREVLFCPYF